MQWNTVQQDAESWGGRGVNVQGAPRRGRPAWLATGCARRAPGRRKGVPTCAAAGQRVAEDHEALATGVLPLGDLQGDGQEGRAAVDGRNGFDPACAT